MVTAPGIFVVGGGDYATTLAHELGMLGMRAHAQGDLLAPQGGDHLVAVVDEATDVAYTTLGRVDALVYLDKARSSARQGVEPDHLIDEVFQTTRRFFLAVKSVVPRMTRDKVPGNIIGVCDAAGVCGRDGYLATSAASGALIGMVKCLAKELGRYSIAVNTICHGPMEELPSTGDLSWAERALFSVMGIGKVGNVRCIANNIIHLARGNHWLTGQVLHVDDGLIM